MTAEDSLDLSPGNELCPPPVSAPWPDLVLYGNINYRLLVILPVPVTRKTDTTQHNC